MSLSTRLVARFAPARALVRFYGSDDRPEYKPELKDFIHDAKKKNQQKSPLTEVPEMEQHPYAENEPLPEFPGGVNPETGEIGGPKGDKGNLIPLPPRDRARSLLLSSSKPRHERKHPLIIPTGMAHSLPHSHAVLCQNSSNYGEKPGGQLEEQPEPSQPPRNVEGSANKHSTDLGDDDESGGEAFDEMIAESFDLLDRLDGESSGDEGYDEQSQTQLSDKTSVKSHLPPLAVQDDGSGCDEGVSTDTFPDAVSPASDVHTPVGVAVPFLAETAAVANSKISRTFTEVSKPFVDTGKPPKDISVPPQELPKPEKQEDDTPEVQATVSQLVEKLDYRKELKAQLGTMSRVLHNKVSEDDCLAALETTGGNVHRGIKLARMRLLVGDDDLEALMTCLEMSSWDVTAAATARLSTHS